MTTELPKQADVVIIGGGIMGLAIAHHLAPRVKNVVVLERGYLCAGASGRNGGGVRAQWSSEDNIRLMRESLRMCGAFATKMGINVWFRRGGYLFIARNRARSEQLAQSVDLQRRCGLATRMISPAEAGKIVPELDSSTIDAASYNPDDGVVFPWAFLWGYAKACEEQGVDVRTFTSVIGLETRDRTISCVITDRGPIDTSMVIVAAGAWSPEITQMVGLHLPTHPHRHEICSSEPLKPFLQPLVADLDSGLYFSQSMRGEIVGGISNAHVPAGLNQGSSIRFLGLYARELVRTAPILSGVRVLRQWGGCYDVSPDGAPIIGRVDEVRGLVLCSGFTGHGFMIAPVIGKLMAEHLIFGSEKELFEKWNLRRFREGRLLKETMILG